MENKQSNECAVCGSRRIHYSFSINDHRIVNCDNCKLMSISPQPSDEMLGEIYGGDYFVLSSDQEGLDHVAALKRSTAERYLNSFLKEGDESTGTLLEIGCGDGDFLSVAAERGLQVTGVEYSSYACEKAREKVSQFGGEVIQGEIEVLSDKEEYFDYIVFCDLLEHVRDPRAFLRNVHSLLKPDGMIFCIVPDLESWSAKLLGTNWMEFKLEHLWYFTKRNLRSLLYQENFSEFELLPAKKTLSLSYITAHFDKHPVPFWSSVMSFSRWLLPKALMDKPFPITASGFGIVGRKQLKSKGHQLSVVMPAYNEASTIEAGIRRVLDKKMPEIEIDLIIVESNSNDGTREIVESYKDHPDVSVILEDAPKGKGHAVRTGLKVAKGDFILIQDADDEYDIEDYDALLEPLIDGRESFVLGARHGGGAWKMRQFSDQPFRAFILNCGHWVFATMLNILYGVRLKDAFTMYKVFRKDCIKGIEFECNRFDFDYELVIKLIKSGHRPIEIPVNYRSRSFLEGKKVNMFSDPISWIIALFKYRFTN